MSVNEPDLVLEGSHLGRGSSYYDKEVSLWTYIMYDIMCDVHNVKPILCSHYYRLYESSS